MKDYDDTIDKGTYIEVDTKTKQILKPTEYQGFQLEKLPDMEIPHDKREVKLALKTKTITKNKKAVSFDISTNIVLKEILLNNKKLAITNSEDYHYITKYRAVHPTYTLTLKGKDKNGEFEFMYDCNTSSCTQRKKDEL